MRRLLAISAFLLACLAVGCKRKTAVIVRAPKQDVLVSPQVIGCPADGQLEAEPAPEHPDAPAIQLPSAIASRLAYYQGKYGLGVLAPVGWHCLNLEGSNGSSLLVTPELITGEQFFADGFKGINGPGVQLSGRDAGTSGRFEVAAMIRRVFPIHEDFANQVIAEGIESAKDMPKGPYAADKLIYLNPEWLEYTTPARAEGLGTHTHLNANDQPVKGFVMLAGDPEEYDLVQLSVRLTSADSDLVSVISKQAEAEAKSEAKGDSQP